MQEREKQVSKKRKQARGKNETNKKKEVDNNSICVVLISSQNIFQHHST
jgi:hypothetical protein